MVNVRKSMVTPIFKICLIFTISLL
jgi:hypothetical protein